MKRIIVIIKFLLENMQCYYICVCEKYICCHCEKICERIIFLNIEDGFCFVFVLGSIPLMSKESVTATCIDDRWIKVADISSLNKVEEMKKAKRLR